MSTDPPTRTVGAWRIGDRIGAGSYATVFRAFHTQSNAPAAVKEVATDRLPAKLAAGVDREVAALAACSASPHVLQLLDVVRAPGRVFIVTEFCAGGDVASLLRAGGPLPERAARALAVQLADGLAALRARSIVHRDLKPHNLLLVPPAQQARGATAAAPGSPPPGPTLKIADFGFARVLGPGGGPGDAAAALADTLCGSPLYMAPEILRHQRYDAKADMWSVGAILYELVAGVPPYGGGNHVALLRDIESRRAALPPAVAAAASPALAALLDGLLRRNPVERLSFDEFYGHEWLRGGDGAVAPPLPPPTSAPTHLPPYAAHVPPLTPPRAATAPGSDSGAAADYVFVDASASTVAAAAAAAPPPRPPSLAAAARVAASPLLAAGAGLLLRRTSSARSSPRAATPAARASPPPPARHDPTHPPATTLLAGAAALADAAAHAAASGRPEDALSLRLAALQALAAVAGGRAGGADEAARAAAAARGAALAAAAVETTPSSPTTTALPPPWDLAYAAALADARAGAAGEVGPGAAPAVAYARAASLLALLLLDPVAGAAVFDPPPRLARERAAAVAAVAAAVAERVAAVGG